MSFYRHNQFWMIKKALFAMDAFITFEDIWTRSCNQCQSKFQYSVMIFSVLKKQQFFLLFFLERVTNCVKSEERVKPGTKSAVVRD